MDEADLLLLDPQGREDERVAGYLLTGPLRWRPGAQCQLERDALSRLFAGLEAMRHRGEGVVLERSGLRTAYRILGVDSAGQALELTRADAS